MNADNSTGRRTWMITVMILLAILSIAGWFRLRVDSTIEPLLPEKSEARQTFAFLNSSSFASTFVLWFRLRDGAGTADQLFAAADDVEKHLDPQLVKGVMHPPQEADAVDQMMGLLDEAGELLNANDLKEVEQTTQPDALRKRMHDCYMQLLRPEGSFMQEMFRKDPLGTNTRILARISELTKGMGFRVEIKGGRLMNPDGRQLLLILQTATGASDFAGSEKLVAELNHIAANAPREVEIIPVGAQIHTVDNQRMMQKDMRFAGIANGIVFLALFLLVSRDWRVASIFLMPLLSIAITIGLCALIYPTLSIMVIGIALSMAGSAVDYGIFVYTAVTSSKDRRTDLKRIRVPLLISHLTTLGVFLAFLFSAIPAYRQLGWLTSISLVLSLLAALFVLPHFIKPGGKIFLLGSGMPLQKWGKLMVPMTIVGTVCMLVALFYARKTNFNSDISKLDGISPEARKNEVDFQNTWGRTDAELGLVVVSGKTRGQAEEANDQIYALLNPKLPAGEFVSLSSFWPSAATRRANQARWNQFWSKDRVEKFRHDLDVAGEPFGFAADAFQPFFDSLAHPPALDQTPNIVAMLADHFVAKSGDEYQMLSYFPDTASNVAEMHKLLRDQPEAQIVSRRALADAFARSALSETWLLVSISSIFIIGFLLLLTRSFIRSFLIMLPAFTGLLAMLAVLAALHFSMNMVTVVAAIAVLALASDYGVFAVYAWENKEPLLGQGMASIHLCALTTATGTAALIFAHHPALLLVGISLTSGLLGGYTTALFVIPGLCFLLDKHRKRKTAIQ
jgi:predicted exporter